QPRGRKKQMTTATTRFGLVKFDLISFLPTSTRVKSATLQMVPIKMPPKATIWLLSVGGEWSEAETTDLNAPPIVMVPVAAMEVPRRSNQQSLDADVTDIVRRWVTNPSQNNGFALKAEAGETVIFATKENVPRTPRLIVVFEESNGGEGAAGGGGWAGGAGGGGGGGGAGGGGARGGRWGPREHRHGRSSARRDGCEGSDRDVWPLRADRADRCDRDGWDCWSDRSDRCDRSRWRGRGDGADGSPRTAGADRRHGGHGHNGSNGRRRSDRGHRNHRADGGEWTAGRGRADGAPRTPAADPGPGA